MAPLQPPPELRSGGRPSGSAKLSPRDPMLPPLKTSGASFGGGLGRGQKDTANVYATFCQSVSSQSYTELTELIWSFTELTEIHGSSARPSTQAGSLAGGISAIARASSKTGRIAPCPHGCGWAVGWPVAEIGREAAKASGRFDRGDETCYSVSRRPTSASVSSSSRRSLGDCFLFQESSGLRQQFFSPVSPYRS